MNNYPLTFTVFTMPIRDNLGKISAYQEAMFVYKCVYNKIFQFIPAGNY